MAATTANNVRTPSSTEQFLRRNGLRLALLTVLLVIILWRYGIDARDTTSLLSATLRQSTPLVLGALCGLWGERSGVINIGIEGQMLLSAFLAFWVNSVTGNLLLGVFVGVGVGALMGLFLAWMSVTLKMDQIIGGTVINILAFGITGYFYQIGLTTSGKFLPIPLGPLVDIPLIGPVLFNNPPLTYLTLLLVALSHYVIFFTRWGLRSRAVGEHPRAADTVGINVFWTRYVNVTAGGAFAGLAGAYLTLEAVGAFERGMTNGRGFLALAVMIFGKYTPFGAWGAALLFGFTVALNNQLQFSDMGGLLSVLERLVPLFAQFSDLSQPELLALIQEWVTNFRIPPQFIGMLPYLLTILVLAGFVGRTHIPAADGVPYEKE